MLPHHYITLSSFVERNTQDKVGTYSSASTGTKAAWEMCTVRAILLHVQLIDLIRWEKQNFHDEILLLSLHEMSIKYIKQEVFYWFFFSFCCSVLIIYSTTASISLRPILTLITSAQTVSQILMHTESF